MDVKGITFFFPGTRGSAAENKSEAGRAQPVCLPRSTRKTASDTCSPRARWLHKQVEAVPVLHEVRDRLASVWEINGLRLTWLLQLVHACAGQSRRMRCVAGRAATPSSPALSLPCTGCISAARPSRRSTDIWKRRRSLSTPALHSTNLVAISARSELELDVSQTSEKWMQFTHRTLRR